MATASLLVSSIVAGSDQVTPAGSTRDNDNSDPQERKKDKLIIHSISFWIYFNFIMLALYILALHIQVYISFLSIFFSFYLLDFSLSTNYLSIYFIIYLCYLQHIYIDASADESINVYCPNQINK